MDGEIWLESDKNKGCEFYFTVIMKKESDAEEIKNESCDSRKNAEAESEACKRVLVVDDDELNRFYISRLSMKHNTDAMTADSGAEALKMLSSHTFDLILMDIQMHMLDGLETTKKIRELEKTALKNVPIIAMTAYPLTGEIENSINQGMDDCI